MGERSSLSIKCLSCAERGLPQYRPRRLWPSTIERGPQRGRTLHCMARAPIASRFGNEQTAPHPDGDRCQYASVGDHLSSRNVSPFFGSQDQSGVGDLPGIAKFADGHLGVAPRDQGPCTVTSMYVVAPVPTFGSSQLVSSTSVSAARLYARASFGRWQAHPIDWRLPSSARPRPAARAPRRRGGRCRAG